MKKIIQPAINALKYHGFAFLLIQICGGFVVYSYYHFTEFQNLCSYAAQWKIKGGFFFAAWTTVIAGAVLPEIAKALTGKIPPWKTLTWWKDFLYIALYFSVLGILIDILYLAQTELWGNGIDFKTLTIKTFVDLAIWSPFFDVPFAVLFFRWRDLKFNLITTLKSYTLSSYKTHILPLLIPLWLYWLPMVFFIYAMPSSLQFCFFLFSEAAWSIIAIFIIQSGRKPHGNAEASAGAGTNADSTHWESLPPANIK